ncbi:MAG: FliH/SctL family protein [Firmicutes bacterium]|nr:FliH/SctL family protein [Bacillota bacterium]
MSRIFHSGQRELPLRMITARALPISPENGAQTLSEAEIAIAEARSTLASLLVELEGKREAKKEVEAEALAIVDRAEQGATALLLQAREEGERLREQAQAQGRQEGLTQGRLEAIAECQFLLEEAQQTLLLAERERRSRVLGAESQLAELALLVVKRMLTREVPFDAPYFMELANQLLEEVDKAHRVEIHAAASDFPLLLAHRSALEKVLYSRAELILLPDHALQPGDLLVVTDLGTVDGRLDTRLEGIRQVLISVAKEWERRDSLGDETAEV